ncbi:methyl-accepting chemotaxis protein [Tepidimonas charontis]|uniref:Methyl-accepting chemotaxis protein I n=1 Tax=Tepidimonas charontis TaxID=2267262 RepID=A0A554XIR4_9BURK|nr:methyl-accepting chemotaxis protein [Tepidimonas charontis]TSE35717.1 Methyl-accepting chemotaxis protein I [Tepidimonas charontis]
MRDLKLASKLWLGVGLLLVALTAVVVTVSIRSVQSTRHAEQAVGRQFDKMMAVAHWVAEAELALATSAVDAGGACPGGAVLRQVLGPMGAQRVERAAQQVQSLLVASEQSAWRALQQRWQAVQHGAQRLAALPPGAADAMADDAQAQYVAQAQAFLQSARQYAAQQREALDAIQADIAVERRTSLVLGASLMALLMGAIVLGAWGLIRHIRQPLQRVVACAQRIAQGTLSQPLDSTRGDEFGVMIRELEVMRAQLASVVAGVRDSAQHISAAAAQIAAGNQDLSQRTERSAAHLQEAVARLHELSSDLGAFVQAARAANGIAEQAATHARSSEEVVHQVVETMRGIRASSERIADIVGVIDNLAFQTNILALNAAVEAARAGEAGRGFAVVAGEVRALAQRSAHAAGEIRQLIDGSVAAVADGTQRVDRAGQTIGELIAEVMRLRDTIVALAQRSERQAVAVGELQTAWRDIDQSTQQNAALVEQTAAAATHLSAQARVLEQSVGRFQLA